MNHECENCRGKFENPGKRSRFCSKKCSHQSWYQRNKLDFLAYAKRYREETNYSKKRHQNLRLKALQKVAGSNELKCSRCGVSDTRILEINHINGNGHKEISQKRSSYYWFTSITSGERKLDDLNVLCKVCNAADFVEKRYGLSFDIRPNGSKKV